MEGSTKNVNFMTPGVGILVLGRVDIVFFLKIFFFTSRHRSDKLSV